MGKSKSVLAYYITPHGFGHAVRSCEILRRLLRLEPDAKIIIISDLPNSLIQQNIGRKIEVRRLRLDVGLCQNDSLSFDLDRTLSVLNGLRKDSERVVREEVKFLRDNKVRAVVSDIASLPFEAAYRCGIPAIGIGNFTWDWIYRAYSRLDSRWDEIIEWIRQGYSKGEFLLQLPMNGDCSAFRRIVEVPLVARKAAHSRDEVRSRMGLAGDKPVVLVSFTSLGIEREAFRRLEKIQGITFIYKGPLKFPVAGAIPIDGFDVAYQDAVAAADAVITKPGYGIVSDCLANGARLIYTERGDFLEYGILVRAVQDHISSVFIDSLEFSAGNWEASIRQVMNLPRKFPDMRMDGADVCAGKILELITDF